MAPPTALGLVIVICVATSGFASNKCSSDVFDKAAVFLSQVNTGAAYEVLQQASCPGNDSGLQRLRVLKVLIAASEIAKDANLQLVLDSAKGTATSPFSGLSGLKAKVTDEKRQWADRLLSDSNGITEMRDERISMAFGKLPQPQTIVNSAYAFNGTQEKIKSGILPSDAEWSSYESLARLMFLSSTLAQNLGVAPNSSAGMLGYLSVWKDSGLKGEVNFGELTSMAGASMFVNATDSDQLGEDLEALNRYRRASELCIAALSVVSSDRGKPSKECQQVASERIEIYSNPEKKAQLAKCRAWGSGKLSVEDLREMSKPGVMDTCKQMTQIMKP